MDDRRPSPMKTLLVCLLLAVSAVAQSTLDQANDAFAKQDYVRATALFQQATAADAKSGAAWEGLGMASLKSGRYDDAEKAFQHAIDLQWRPYLNRLNIARVAARQGDSAKAFQILNDLVASGRASQLLPYLKVVEFNSIRQMPEFAKVEDGLKPCRAPEYRQFDFWAGDWEVQNPRGQTIGSSSVTVEQDRCLLVEHWKSGLGYETGTSFNYYSNRDDKWHQLYVANNNGTAHPEMRGVLENGRMVLITDVVDGVQSRWTWYELAPGKVRQMAEQTTDGGKTWQITWDSVYIKKSPSAAAK